MGSVANLSKSDHTVEDVWAITEKCELYEGKLFMMAGAGGLHEQIVANLIGEMYIFFKGKDCAVYGSNLAVVPPLNAFNVKKEKNYYLPDIKVICDNSKFMGNDYYGAPALVVEILSPSTAFYDKLAKYRMYERIGVKEYWIADPAYRQIEQYALVNNKYELTGVYGMEDTLTSVTFEGLSINIKDIFPEINEVQ